MMMSVAMIFLFGLFQDDSPEFIDKYFIRVTDPAELPDFKRTQPIEALPGWRGGLYGESKFGYRPGKCTAPGQDVVARVKAELGEPITMERLGGAQTAWFWRWRENPEKGFLIRVTPEERGVVLKGWAFDDKVRNGRLPVPVEDRIYRWFDRLVGR